MKLKSLEIIGFKSFVERTVVTFDRDITGVVGPNGCGKSNIVDAIRWVMGEQSAKHLRGKAMEDVIFAGSDSRAPLSMASVELTFATEGFQTPASYLNHSEISICRRLYRSGESEYFINKTPVRLKDITDLFLGTGVGTKAYSIIEQGRISQIVTAKPEERRYYIEEVAGTSRFKVRKEAALRKMEATQQNLLRLTDLIIELERQLKSLERQAKKAEKYREVRTEFDHWDTAYSSHLFAADQKLQDEYESQLRHFGENEALCKARLQEEENHLEAARHDLLERERELQQTQHGLFEVTNIIRLLEATLRYKTEEKSAQSGRIESAKAEQEEIAHVLESLKGGLYQINGQKVLAELDEAHRQEQVEALSVLLSEVQTQMAQGNAGIENLREVIHSSQSRLAQIDTLRVSLLQKKEDLTTRLAHDEQELERLSAQFKAAERICREAHQSLDGLKQLKFDLTQRTDLLSGDLGAHKQNLKNLEAEIAQVREELTVRKSRLHSLVELERNFEGYQEGPRQVLLKRHELADGGIMGSVAEFVETEPQYEGAVSAVLGERLQYVIVRQQAQGVEAIDYLRTASGGRSSFIPMEVRVHEETVSGGEIPSQPGVLGPLSNFVNLKAHDNLKQFLFGDVVLVEDLHKALDLWSVNGHRKTLVTLGGEVVDPSGVISGGSLTNTSKALLEKKREIKDLMALIEELEARLQDKEASRAELAGKVYLLEESLEEVRRSSFEEEIRIANQEKDVSHLRRELDGLEQKQRELSTRVLDLRTGLDEVAPVLTQIDDEEGVLKSTLEENQRKITSERERVDGLLASSEADSEKLTHLKIELAQSRETNRHLGAEIERLEGEMIRLRLKLAGLEAETEQAMAREKFLGSEIAHNSRVMTKRLEKKADLDATHTQRREAYEAATARIREIELALKDLRTHAESASQNLHTITVQLTEVRGRMKALVEQFLERHQRSLADIFRDHLTEDFPLAEAEEKVRGLKEALGRLGDVNTGALSEFEEIKTRYDFLKKQKEDLEESLRALERVITKINRTTRERFITTFNLVNECFQSLFPKLFRGGQASLMLTDENNPLETGVEIIAQPPGKKLQSISLLSGGEKALTAVSLIFAIFQVKPSPFCLLDEVDAPLDDVNVGRYNDIIREMTSKTQFVVITHNKKTMEVADTLYGVTMQEPGSSQIVSVDLQ